MPAVASSPEATPRLPRELVPVYRALRASALAVAILLVAALISAEPASAFWRASGSGSTTAAVATLLPPTNVSVPASSNSNVTVSWTGPGGSVLPTGYYITRITGSTVVAACGSSLAAPVAATTCTDISVPEGTHRYQVTAVHRSWTAPGPVSGNVAVTSIRDLSFDSQPSPVVTAGSPVSSFDIQLRTIFGFPVRERGVPVTVSLGANPVGGTLSGQATAVTDSGGTASFSGLSIDKAGAGYTLIASSPGYAGIASKTFTVVPAAAAKLVVTGGTALTGPASNKATLGPVTVQRQDAYGNPVTAEISNISLATSSAASSIFAATANGAMVTAVTIPAGSSSASFFYANTKAGTATITVASNGLAAPTPITATITAATPSSLQFGAMGSNIKRNQLITPSVAVSILDAYGNATEAGQVSLQSMCNLKGTLSQPGTAGLASFPDLLIVGSGNFASCTLTATSGTLSVTSTSFTLN
ncbi:Fibronectin type III domain protein [Arthrobacter sp. 9AX]|uniref:hypothetical protein n=1 Tax=Arthrobacter sp. 9AX TaxID=2653131 RepID=UPI0012F3B980|nr:hypothetical protein [Arthrobacter sp. 9AX]VXB75286.1 Fibronectin type III domain protein [Arthrobacter sp. 9AX]